MSIKIFQEGIDRGQLDSNFVVQSLRARDGPAPTGRNNQAPQSAASGIEPEAQADYGCCITAWRICDCGTSASVRKRRAALSAGSGNTR